MEERPPHRLASYLKCSHCDWRQDYFWGTINYNPIRHLMHLESSLLNQDLDAVVPPEEGSLSGLPRRVKIATLMQKASSKVLSMRWRTREEWQKDPHPYCPQCDSELEVVKDE